MYVVLLLIFARLLLQEAEAKTAEHEQALASVSVVVERFGEETPHSTVGLSVHIGLQSVCLSVCASACLHLSLSLSLSLCVCVCVFVL